MCMCFHNSASLQYITRNPDSLVVVWVDLMKLGRCSSADVDQISELVAASLSKRPHRSAAVVHCPMADLREGPRRIPWGVEASLHIVTIEYRPMRL